MFYIKNILYILFFLVSLNVYCQNQSEFKADVERSSKCYRDIEDDKRIDLLHNKIGKLNLRESDAPTIEMLSDKSKPTKNEKTALSTWGESRQECDNSRKIVFEKYSELSEIGSLWMEQNKKFYDLLVNLYSGDISYGDFNKRRYDLKLESDKKLNDVKKAYSSVKEREAEKLRQQKLIDEKLKTERQAVLDGLLNNQAINERKRNESCALLDVNCSLGLIMYPDFNKYKETVDRINAYILTQEIRWVKGEIAAVDFATAAYDYHKNLLDIDSYDREEYLFYMKIAKAYDAHQISLTDSVYLIEKNNNQISERRAARQSPRSINYTCQSEMFGGTLTTKCH